MQRPIEYYGLGQSGYTAGRREADRALDERIEVRNVSPPNRDEDEGTDLGDDERFTGRGGRRWVLQS